MFIVYISRGPAEMVGTKVAEFHFCGFAVKCADRLNEIDPDIGYSIRFEE